MTGSKQVRLAFHGMLMLSVMRRANKGKGIKEKGNLGRHLELLALYTTKKRGQISSADDGWPKTYIMAALLSTISTDSLVVSRCVAIFEQRTTGMPWHEKHRVRLERPISMGRQTWPHCEQKCPLPISTRNRCAACRRNWSQGGCPKRKVAHGVAICPWGDQASTLSA